MSLLRRRALLAASQPSGGGEWGDLPTESTRFEFPLYLNITKLDYKFEDVYEYLRESDDISSQLYDWFAANAEQSKIGRYEYIDLDDTCQIYINGVAMRHLTRYEMTEEILFFDAPTPFAEIFLDRFGLYGVIYK